MARTKGARGTGPGSERGVFDLKWFLEKILRASFRRTPMYHAARNAAKEEYTIYAKNGNPQRRVHFKCAICGRMFKSTDTAVDHKIPVGSIDTLEGFIQRLFCDVGNLQILCNYKKADAPLHGNVESCHRIKTRKEAEERARKRLGL